MRVRNSATTKMERKNYNFYSRQLKLTIFVRHKVVLTMEETEGYKNDVIGLKTLNEAGKIRRFESTE